MLKRLARNRIMRRRVSAGWRRKRARYQRSPVGRSRHGSALMTAPVPCLGAIEPVPTSDLLH